VRLVVCVIVGGTDGLWKWSALNESLLGRIFISYRRQETAWHAWRLYDVLVEHFRAEQVFKDVDSIEPGDDFVERITATVESGDVLLALIGPQWLTITNNKGQRRLDDPEDHVRLEIETALTRMIPVIPILVDEAKMPGADELPATLAPLVDRPAVEINPLTFDTKQLMATVSKTLDLELARRQQELASNYAQASAAADAGDWEQAAAKYSMVAAAVPGYRDTNDRLAEARRQQLATLEAEAQRLYRAGQWAAVIKVGEQLQAIDPAFDDADGLIRSALAEVDVGYREAALAANYEAGLRLFHAARFDAGRWEEAIAALERVTRLDPTYRDAPALLGGARQELARATFGEEYARWLAEEEARWQARRQAGEEQTEEQARAEAEAILSKPLVPPPAQHPTPAADENVQFTVYRPPIIKPGIWYSMLAFAHLAERRPDAPPDEPDPLELVRELAAQSLGDKASDYEGPRAESRGAVPKESELTFVPYAEDIDFNPRRQSFEWQEDVHQQNFRLRAKSGAPSRVVGQMTVYLGACILADVDLVFRVDPAAAPPNPRPVAATLLKTTGAKLSTTRLPRDSFISKSPYRKIFLSYSHDDTAIVEQAERLGAALGDTYLRDRTTLHSGEDWYEGLLKLIDKADIFQLFWSSNSMRSEYVRQEWEHAVTLARPNFIRPTYWEQPMPRSDNPLLPPSSLSQLHFHSLVAPQAPEPEAAEQAQREALAQARREAEAQALAQARRQAERSAPAQAQREAEAQAQQEALAQARREAEAQAQRSAPAQAQREAEAQAQRSAPAQAQRSAPAQAQREAEAQAQRSAPAQARREAEAQAQREALAQARREAEQSRPRAAGVRRTAVVVLVLFSILILLLWWIQR
jgi:tetratricopeptide (TPR) repeat protein